LFKFEAFNILFKSLFEKIASVVTIYNISSLIVLVVSVQEILYLRCILGHKNGGFRASERLPNKHECLRQGYANNGN